MPSTCGRRRPLLSNSWGAVRRGEQAKTMHGKMSATSVRTTRTRQRKWTQADICALPSGQTSYSQCHISCKEHHTLNSASADYISLYASDCTIKLKVLMSRIKNSCLNEHEIWFFSVGQRLRECRLPSPRVAHSSRFSLGHNLTDEWKDVEIIFNERKSIKTCICCVN